MTYPQQLTLPEKRCANCDEVMDMGRAVWWTEKGTCCPEACARELTEAS